VEFGVGSTMQLVAPFAFHSDLHALGPAAIQGMPVAAPFYWDLNDATRAWSQRFRAQTGRAPDVGHAGTYTALTHYFKAIAAAQTDETTAVVAAMRALPIDDMSTRGGTIRGDGMVERPIYLFRGKTPAESKDPWDLLQLVDTIAKEKAFPMPTDAKCPLLRT
ncbi:ABC transporter substrate-binding protein, partial [Jatrophihabitans endophyticus]|uniref:ABC transporter substrate-binding protein n=1 Tax=Jatrophihabitans endophyticus TaxID=1206085 RepID=UPI0019EF4F75